MSEEILEEQNEKKQLDVLPANKGKRFLLFLGDFFLNFVLSYLLFTLMVLPLGKLMTSYSTRQKQTTDNIALRSEIMKENKLLFFNNEAEESDVLYSASFTFFCYFSYFVYDEAQPVGAMYSQYGHKSENNIFEHYFFDIAGEEEKYYSFFDKYNNDKYFIRNGSDISLKDDVKTLIFPCFDKSDTPSKDGETMIGTLENKFFYPMYSEMMYLIEHKTDLFFEGHSYNHIQTEILAFDKYSNNLAVYCSFIALFLSTAVLYVVIPLTNRNRKTITMLIMRLERVNSATLDIVKKPKVFINAIYAFVASMLIAFFVPATFLTIYGIFNLPVLMVFGIFSLMLMTASLVFLLINQFNMDMFDYFTKTVILKTETLDDIYRARGYYI